LRHWQSTAFNRAKVFRRQLVTALCLFAKRLDCPVARAVLPTLSNLRLHALWQACIGVKPHGVKPHRQVGGCVLKVISIVKALACFALCALLHLLQTKQVKQWCVLCRHLLRS
jgi:hypothetical protein